MKNTRPSGGSRRSIVGQQSSYFIIQEASQLNVTVNKSQSHTNINFYRASAH